MTDVHQSKKRKRDEHDSKCTLKLSDSSAGVGPVVVTFPPPELTDALKPVTFPAIEPARTTPFRFYIRESTIAENSNSNKGFEIENGIIVGETDTIDLYTGIRDQKTNKITLRNAPLHVLARDVKAVKSLDPLTTKNHEEWIAAKNALGETFGSKKTKQAIKTMERNKIDVSAMENVVGHIQGSIESGTLMLPTKEEAKVITNENRPIPPCNTDASSPDEVYVLSDIIPGVEYDSIIISRLLTASDEAKRSCLPYSRSQWINDHLESEFKPAKPNKKNLATREYRDKELLQKKMSSVPNEITEGLFERFTEKSRNETKHAMTNDSQTRLLTYMFALCLKLDNYATDPTVLASDLGLNPAIVTKHFKQLGCRVEALSTAERARRGLGPPSTNESKRCVLRIPLEFPKQPLHRRLDSKFPHQTKSGEPPSPTRENPAGVYPKSSPTPAKPQEIPGSKGAPSNPRAVFSNPFEFQDELNRLEASLDAVISAIEKEIKLGNSGQTSDLLDKFKQWKREITVMETTRGNRDASLITPDPDNANEGGLFTD
ncbi:hypothetical protein Clacol_003589 [Clathrus columnatus]|uniref:DNA-directed RNA polymerase I subunit RPA49 n=1 Tax=Clathrus columnatus TaxID=1419009 RepID=A0AAV5A6S3_9AGAM|nr:hypothetical protein Clacol_003589 [Clathrus columnatus]